MEHFIFSTCGLSPREAVARWADEALPPLEAQLTAADLRNFSCTMTGRRRAEIAMAQVELSSYAGIWRENARLPGRADALRIFRVQSGQVNFTTRGGDRLSVAAGQSLLCGPDALVSYAIVPTTNGGVALTGDMTTLPLKNLSSFAGNLPRDLTRSMPLSPIGGLVNSYVDALRSELTTDRDFKRLINNFTELIAVGLGSGERLLSSPPLLDAYYEQAIDIIGNRFRDQRLQSAYVAERLGISERTLFKAFEQRERSFHSELTMRRIGAASFRLRCAADSASILDILYDSGFESVSTFSRAFKAVHGMTASEYRNRARRLASS